MRKCAPGNSPSTICTLPPWAFTNSSTTDKADAGALEAAALRGTARIERLEDVRAILVGNAGAVVGYIQHQSIAHLRGAHVNGAALGEYFTAFDNRFSRIRRTLPRSATSVHVFDLHVETHAL